MIKFWASGGDCCGLRGEARAHLPPHSGLHICHSAVGDTVAEDEVVCEIETDKVGVFWTKTFSSSVAGTLYGSFPAKRSWSLQTLPVSPTVFTEKIFSHLV